MKKVSLSVYEKIGFEYKITFLYFIIGLLWILLSDTFFDLLIQDKDLLTRLQIVKGFFYIAITSILLFFLIQKHVKALCLAKEKAEESDRLKSAFLANMSHEIRTPMNGILGFAEILKEPGLSGEEQQECISIIQKSGTRMLNIINDIICISKVEAGQMEIVVSETDINEQIEYIYTFFKPEVEDKGMRLIMKKGLATQGAFIRTDREKLYAILTNLVKNAIKYSNAGTIEFGYRIVNRDMGRDKACLVSTCPGLEFFVKDTGIGIPKDRQQAIFERFVQADISDRMALQGAGLGLSISKAYVEMLGGNIWMESEPGKGSIFYFTIPFNNEQEENEIAKNDDPVEPTANRIKKLKILIVEDDEASEFLLSRVVKRFSKTVLKVRTGIAAIEACRNNPDIDLVLLDMKMPEMNGYDAARRIRQFNKDVIIIAQTAYGLLGDREKALEAGCNDYISKPILTDELMQVLQKYFNKQDVNC